LAAVSNPNPVQAFFEADTYLEHNAIIPVRALIVAELLSGLQNARILDLGCGDGSVSRALLAAQNKLTLVDFSPKMLERARAATPPDAPVEFIEANILRFDPPEPFDAVICVGVLAHVPSLEEVLGRVSAVVRPGGVCVLQITDAAAPLGRVLNQYYRWRRREHYLKNQVTLTELVAAADRHDLSALDQRRHGLLLPGMGKLPYRWECRLENAVWASPYLSHLGAEVIVSFQKRRTSLALG
jgi:SAM-dependent methyltransferase